MKTKFLFSISYILLTIGAAYSSDDSNSFYIKYNKADNIESLSFSSVSSDNSPWVTQVTGTSKYNSTQYKITVTTSEDNLSESAANTFNSETNDKYFEDYLGLGLGGSPYTPPGSLYFTIGGYLTINETDQIQLILGQGSPDWGINRNWWLGTTYGEYIVNDLTVQAINNTSNFYCIKEIKNSNDEVSISAGQCKDSN